MNFDDFSQARSDPCGTFFFMQSEARQVNYNINNNYISYVIFYYRKYWNYVGKSRVSCDNLKPFVKT
jgi:hypothetical protein